MPKKQKFISRRKPRRITPNSVDVGENKKVAQRMNVYNTCGNDIKPQHNPFSKVETSIEDEKKKFNYDNIFERDAKTNPPQKKKK